MTFCLNQSHLVHLQLWWGRSKQALGADQGREASTKSDRFLWLDGNRLGPIHRGYSGTYLAHRPSSVLFDLASVSCSEISHLQLSVQHVCRSIPCGSSRK